MSQIVSGSVRKVMKDSGIEWLGDVPEHWGIVRLKYVADVLMGQSPDSSNCNIDGIGMPFLQGNADFQERYPRSREYTQEIKKIAIKNSFLFSVRAPVGAINIADQNYAIGRGLCGILPREMNHLFFLYYLQTIKIQLNSIAKGSTYESVSVSDIQNMIGSIPPLPEQQAIATYLDTKNTQIDALINQKKKLITELEAYKSSLISEVVTKGLDPNVRMKDSGIEWLGIVPEHWGIVRLKYVADKIQTGSTPTTKNPEYFGNDINWFTPNDFELFLLGNSNRKISTKAIKDNEAMLFPSDSCLLVCIASIGKVSYCKDISSFNQQITGIHSGSASNLYLSFLFRSISSTFRHIANYCIMPIINNEFLKNVKIPLPPLPEQQAIATYLDAKTTQINHLITQNQSQIQELESYKSSLISEVVTGKKSI